MTTVLERYHRLERRSLSGLEVFTKPGVRGYPELPPGAEPLAAAVAGEVGFVDASGTAGMAALASLTATAGAGPEGRLSPSFGEGAGRPLEEDLHEPGSGPAPGRPPQEGPRLVLEPSMAALRCARRTLEGTAVDLRAGLPWELAGQSAEVVALAPPADKGSARVLAEMSAAAHALTADGAVYLALHKDLGAKRYLRAAGELFGSARIVSRRGGWRLVEAREPKQEANEDTKQGHASDASLDSRELRSESAAGLARKGAGDFEPPWLGFDLEGLRVEALPGVHSAGRLDRGTELLLASMPWPDLRGTALLDLGCGSGVLALRAAAAGALVTAVDDDLAAIRSTRHNSELNGSTLRAIHSDIDSELDAGGFDVVVTNPPFHVGKGVRLAVPEAFMAAAHRLLRTGGELWLVANRELPYERVLASWRRCERVADTGGFKVLRARR